MGYNQDGNLRTYSFSCQRLGFCLVHKTTGYWWRGTAIIQVTNWLGRSKTCQVNVPKVWPSNEYSVVCMAPG